MGTVVACEGWKLIDEGERVDIPWKSDFIIPGNSKNCNFFVMISSVRDPEGVDATVNPINK